MLWIIIAFFAGMLIEICKNRVNKVNMKEKEKQDDDMSLDLNADDWEYQAELLDIIDPDDEDEA